jgi:hypothetical protein
MDRKTAKACGTTGGMDNGVQVDLMGGSAQEPVNLEDTEEHDLLLLQTDRFLHLQATLLKSVRDSTHTEVSSLQEARDGR